MKRRLDGEAVLLTSGFGAHVWNDQWITSQLCDALSHEWALCSKVDMPGHGWDPSSFTFSKATEYFHDAIGELFDSHNDRPVHVVANSLLAKSFADALSSRYDNVWKVASIVLLWPSHNPLATVHAKAKQWWIPFPSLLTPLVLRIPSLKKKRDNVLQHEWDGVVVDSREFYRDLRKWKYGAIDFPPSVPTTIIHNQYDTVNPINDSLYAAMHGDNVDLFFPSQALDDKAHRVDAWSLVDRFVYMDHEAMSRDYEQSSGKIMNDFHSYVVRESTWKTTLDVVIDHIANTSTK